MQATPGHVGDVLKEWRQSRRFTQEQLAERADISTRHISFIETGRSSPSRESLLAIMDALDIPLRERNPILLTAGWAPAYRTSAIDSPALRPVRRALDYILRQQEPFPALVVDRLWNVVQANAGFSRVVARIFPALPAGSSLGNLLEIIFDARGLRPFIVNWEEVAGLLLARFRREVLASPGDTPALDLLERLLATPGLPARWRGPPLLDSAEPFVPVHLRGPDLELRLFTTITTLGTPLDVVAGELRIESYFPADEATEVLLRGWVP